MQNQKKAGTYSLIRGTQTVKQLSKMYKALCRETDDLWHAKVLDNSLIETNSLHKHLEFNEEVLLACQQKQNIIYVKEIFLKNNNTFIIQQIYDETLIEKVTKQHPLPSETIENILNDVVNGLIELYGDRYFTRSVRPEHIVCVHNVWKIQAFVLNSEIFGVDGEFVWTGEYGSPEDRYWNGKIQEEMVDEQIVWQIGMLGLYMLLGPNYNYERILKDSDIDWQKVQKLTSKQLYEMLTLSLKTKYSQRSRIRDFLQLPIFKDLDISLIMAAFQSQSKFFTPKNKPITNKPTTTTTINKTLSQDDTKIWDSLKSDIERFKIFGEVDRYVQELSFKNSDIVLLRYLSFRVCWENLRRIEEQSGNWVSNDERVRGNQQLEYWLKDLKLYINDIQRSKLKNHKLLSPTSQLPLLKQLLPVSESTLSQKIIQVYWRITGHIYSTLSKKLQKQTPYQSQEMQRTLYYYSLCACLIHDFKREDFTRVERFVVGGVFNVREYVGKGDLEGLREGSQDLIRKYYQVMPM